jgi:hypothetical protein
VVFWESEGKGDHPIFHRGVSTYDDGRPIS